MLPRADGHDDAGAVPGADDRVLRIRRTVDEVPLPQRPLLALDDQHRLAGHDEEVLLVGLPVIHRHRLARPEHADVDPELREVQLALEVAERRAPLRVVPARVAGVEDEPAVRLRDETIRGLLELRLGNHGGSLNAPAAGLLLLREREALDCQKLELVAAAVGGVLERQLLAQRERDRVVAVGVLAAGDPDFD